MIGDLRRYLSAVIASTGRQQTLEVLAHHTEGLLTQRFLRHDLERSFSQTIQVLVQALEMHDEYTAGHSDWVGVYARLGGLALGWDRRAVARAGHAGLLHDIGKVRLDSSMINHPGKLTDEQFEHFRAHPVVGAEMLKPLTSMEDILPAVCWHHERFEVAATHRAWRCRRCPQLSHASPTRTMR